MKTYFIIFMACVLAGNLLQAEAACAEPNCEGIQCSMPKCTPPDSLQTDKCHCCPYCAEKPHDK
nr:unnamed protein product [Callosobruchus chinensis]